MTNESLIEEQLRREEQQRSNAMALSLAKLEEAAQSGQIDSIPAVRALIRRAFEPLRDSIKEMLDNKATRAVDLEWYRRIGPEAVTMLLLRQLCSAAVQGEVLTLQRLCMPLGRMIMQEAHVLDAFQVNPLYMQRSVEYLKEKNVRSESHAAKTMLVAAAKVMDEDFKPPASEALQVGKWALDCAMRLGLVQQQRTWTDRNQLQVTYGLDSELESLLLNTTHIDFLAGTALLMLAPPMPWKPGQAGGYLLQIPNRGRLAYKTSVQDRKLSRAGLEQSKALLSCLNSLQSTPLCIEQRGIRVVRAAWAGGRGGVLGIPSIHGP